MIKILLLAVVPFMTQHRNVVPKTEVSTNFYGSVTGIVDNAYIQAHGGGGGDIDTNAVDAIANSAVVTNALTVATTNRVALLETATNNLASSVTGLQSLKADRSTTYTKGETDSLLDAKVSKSGDTMTGVLTTEEGIVLRNRGIYVSGEDIVSAFPVLDGYDGVYPVRFRHGLSTKTISGISVPQETSGETFALLSDIPAPQDETDPHFTEWLTSTQFTNDVLAVGLNIDTNSVAVLNEIASTFGGFPLGAGETATTVCGLLAALAAAIAWLKKNKVQTLKLNDNSVETSADGGVAKLDDFFTESNSLLTGTIDDRLPIPISTKSAGFTTESYKRFIVTVSGDMTVTLHTPTGEDAEIFECRFNGTGLDADASITFAGAAAITMDTDCGTVTAGKVALMSAFWNGATWDVNWKVGG